MTILKFDLEADGLLDTVSTIHCLVISDGTQRLLFGPDEVHKGVKLLQEALDSGRIISGHNIISYDCPVLEKIYPDIFKVRNEQRGQILDTLVLSRLVFSDVKNFDYALMRKNILPGKLAGRHSLESWGYRLGCRKGDFGKQEGEDGESIWAKFTPEMLDYCDNDVLVQEKLLELCLSKGYSEKAIQLEHEAAWVVAHMERNGFPFDIFKAQQLEVVLRGVASDLMVKLLKEAPPIPDKTFIPQRNNKTKGYITGVPVPRFKEFNPNSRQQIEWILTKHFGYSPDLPELYNLPDEADDWSHEEVYAAITSGKVPLKMDETTFNYIKADTEGASEELRTLATTFAEYLMISKRLGQLADGKQAWLKCVKSDGRIHGSVNPNGAVTGRATHSKPNTAQVPAAHAPYGPECRELFAASLQSGWLQVGVDASGLELRCLGHYMAPYDSGSYAHTVVHGDVHTLNQQAAGLPTRDDAKTFIYAFLYGAGDAKIGKIVKGDAVTGKRLKKKFLDATPAISDIRKALQDSLVETFRRGRVVKWRRRYIIGLDGRKVYVRSLHAALNTLLQSAGALICKKWLCRTVERLENLGLVQGWDGDFAIMAWVHDEFQAAARNQEIAEIIVKEAQEAMRDTQVFFNFRVQLDTEGKIGQNWAECH